MHAARAGWRRWASPWNLLTLAALAWAAPRLLPHLGAVVGLGSGGALRPAFRVALLNNDSLASEQLHGRVVLVNFWATWCLPCRVEMPLLQRMRQRYRGQGFELVGFSVDRGSKEGVRAFLRDRGITYPVSVVDGDVERAFGSVRGYPTSFLIDRRGVVRHAVIGPLAPVSLELAVRRLLAEPPAPIGAR